MENDLVRVENAITGNASGNLTWGRWPLDSAVALGFAGVRNPLGFAVVRFLADEPSPRNAWGVILVLANEMQKQGIPGEGIKELAFQAFEFWKDSRCTSCGGRGISGIEQSLCLACNGSGQRPAPHSPDALRVGVTCLIEAESRMEGQLAARLRRG